LEFILMRNVFVASTHQVVVVPHKPPTVGCSVSVFTYLLTTH
jgi:hypothetical protein